ncbi:MAG: dethiobiotin synthase [Bdellovibrionales bacterium]|nr:dethiobiotin synthase [Bdellovibrionales bacterium]
MQNNLFVTGNGTGIGKTVVSAILAEALTADYWKPIQAGDLDLSDSMTVSSLVTNSQTRVHPESYRLTQPMSPHAAAIRDGIAIELSQFRMPKTSRPLIIEGAGGLLVPLNRNETIIDLISYLEAPVLFVSQHYLGSINHTLLSLEALERRNIPIQGIIFVGEPNPDTETIIIHMSKQKMLGRIAWEDEISPALVSQYARLLREVL